MNFDKDMAKQYIQAEQEDALHRALDEEQQTVKKLRASLENERQKAKLAFEQTQQNRFEIEALKKSLRKNRILTIICIILTLICMAMVMSDGITSMTQSLP